MSDQSSDHDASTSGNTWPPPHDEYHRRRRQHVRNIDIRRAIFAVLIAARGPVTISEIHHRLVHEHGIRVEAGVHISARQKISDVLRYQRRAGRVIRVRRGTYMLVPGALSRSSTWRCVNWRRVRERRWYTM